MKIVLSVFPPACSVFLDGCGRSRRRRLHSVVAWERVDKSNLDASVYLELCGSIGDWSDFSGVMWHPLLHANEAVLMSFLAPANIKPVGANRRVQRYGLVPTFLPRIRELTRV